LVDGGMTTEEANLFINDAKTLVPTGDRQVLQLAQDGTIPSLVEKGMTNQNILEILNYTGKDGLRLANQALSDILESGQLSSVNGAIDAINIAVKLDVNAYAGGGNLQALADLYRENGAFLDKIGGGLPDYMARIEKDSLRGVQGDITTLHEAAQLVLKGDRIALEFSESVPGKADIINFSTGAATEVKTLQGTSEQALFGDINQAAKQLEGAPAGFSKNILVDITNSSNLKSFTRDQLILELRGSNWSQFFDNVNAIEIRNGAGDFIFSPNDLR
jgi:hypothetical protein